MRTLTITLSLVAMLLYCNSSLAAQDHSEFIEGPFTTGSQVTTQCIECHEDHAADFMKSSHWTWELEQTLPGRTVKRGKKNTINNFCVAISSNEPRCTSCHAGYGWKDNNFDFSDMTKVDCLICHDTTGTYVKDPAGAGEVLAKVNLERVAKNVGTPVRDNCGTCHFYGGGGDGVKHGDLDSSMSYPDKRTDVHMDVDGNDFQCQECHTTKDHQITGNAMGVSPGGDNPIGCINCHDSAPHKKQKLNDHGQAVACQTCHIPEFAKNEPTKMSWDWSTAGSNREQTTDEYGKHSYMKKKGDFVWAKNVKPQYAWYNGKADAYMAGDKMQANSVTKLTHPLGDINDPHAKITPFKVHTGKQIYDKKLNIFITPKVFGKGGYWKTFDWDKAARLGMEQNQNMVDKGIKYSGEYGFAATEMWWPINHMVSPKEDALKCKDCHSQQGRLDWQALGYEGDPMKVKGGQRHTK
ncbi:tetrathionate reductase family octaheme c-type cytochrome [Shewanella schlegeliana]|uniref:Tetrathionate reductase family octaheme c-type cytochrome n=2 Tax=Shewanella schlegeliana TaxID=190308 RepID=A0ABS1T452_9GAMM|nr:tetrathionate reductase family octaheme c-type cytochrome [Shewanella schlegeliana]MBL4915563.1 tetrathionate reductase family octaheme c-type cytochrome [Shewanella schlegeliana]MCL1111870.1 tetrathionate reductase family octaheme c-type cytochrome [Shewanella schlegeliana]GIU37550.1 cytochrome c [Shewanella schlegeliana]